MNVKIEHVAIWCYDLEIMRRFYMKYFNMLSTEKYINSKKSFESYFLRFDEDSSTRIELMKRPDIIENTLIRGNLMGICHIAISVGNRDKVNILTEILKKDNYKVIGEPRVTGDGIYESVIEDPERT